MLLSRAHYFPSPDVALSVSAKKNGTKGGGGGDDVVDPSIHARARKDHPRRACSRGLAGRLRRRDYHALAQACPGGPVTPASGQKPASCASLSCNKRLANALYHLCASRRPATSSQPPPLCALRHPPKRKKNRAQPRPRPCAPSPPLAVGILHPASNSPDLLFDPIYEVGTRPAVSIRLPSLGFDRKRPSLRPVPASCRAPRAWRYRSAAPCGGHRRPARGVPLQSAQTVLPFVPGGTAPQVFRAGLSPRSFFA